LRGVEPKVSTLRNLRENLKWGHKDCSMDDSSKRWHFDLDKKNEFLAQKWLLFPRVCKYIRNLRTSQGYIFFILQHLATKLCNFTHFNMLFPAMVMDFVLLAWIKILSIAGITNFVYFVSIGFRRWHNKRRSGDVRRDWGQRSEGLSKQARGRTIGE
jgi:hypothetical protein